MANRARASGSMKSHRSVAIIVDAASHFGRSVARGAMQYANTRRYWAITSDYRQIDPLTECWPDCDGAIIAGAEPSLSDRVRERIDHIVCCDPGMDSSFAAITCPDAAACGRIAAEHLIDCRLNNFAYCGWSSHSASQQRLSGFRTALALRGFDCVVATPFMTRFNDTLGIIHRGEILPWLRELPKPVGILAYDDWVAHDLAAM